MIKKILGRLSLALPVLLTATQVSAHPSGHDANVIQTLSHMATSPYHLGIMASIAVLLAVIVYTLSKKANQSE